MKIAIDLDGTAWAHRELFKAMITGFIAAGHQVGILTKHNVRSRDEDFGREHKGHTTFINVAGKRLISAGSEEPYAVFQI